MKRASIIRKAWPLICLILGLVASLTVFLIRHNSYIGNLPGLVERNRNTTQVFVQIISMILAAAQMALICSLINFAARIKLFASPTTTSDLSFCKFDGQKNPREDTMGYCLRHRLMHRPSS